MEDSRLPSSCCTTHCVMVPYSIYNLQPRPCQSLFRDPIFSEQIILEEFNSLKVSKSPGLDDIHPRILYELRNEIVLPLKMLFETHIN